MNKAAQTEIKRLMKVYKISEVDAIELYEYDRDHTKTDEDAKEYLLNEIFVAPKVVEEAFTKAAEPVVKTVSRVEKTAQTKATKEMLAQRIDFLVEALGKEVLFGEPVEITNNSIVFIASETGNQVSVKIAKHKEQKVVTKEMKVKTKRAADGTMVELAPTVAELRAKVLHTVIASNAELFEAPSFAGSKVGVANRDPKYPFSSIALTHHKS